MRLKVILAVAIFLDLVLAGMVVHSRQNRSPAPADAVAAAPEPSDPGPVAAEPAPGTARPAVKTAAQGFHWRQIESPDYPRYIANLRSIGCPEETIRDIIVADVNKLYESRKQDLKKNAGPFQYWKAGQQFAGVDQERLKQFQAFDQEKRDLLKELLGINVPEPQDSRALARNSMNEALSFLPPEKQTQAIATMEELQTKIGQLTANRGKQPATNDPAAIKALMSEYDAKLGQIMTPAEKERFDLTVSQTAQNIRNQLGTFNATEQEFQDIYKIRKPFDDEFALAGRPTDPVALDRREAAYFDTERQIRQLLGETRYNEYRAARDYVPNTPLRQIAETEGVPVDRATQVLELRDTARDQALRVRLDASLNEAQREATLSAIQNQTRSAISGLLGEKAAAAYFESSVAKRWIDGLIAGRPKP